MKRGKRLKGFAYSIGTGFFAVFLFLLFYFAANKNTAPFMLILREVFPLYGEGVTSVINLYTYGLGREKPAHEVEALLPNAALETIPGDLDESEPPRLYSGKTNDKPNDEPKDEPTAELIGLENVVYQPGTDISINDNSQSELLTKADLDKLDDFDYLKSKLYTVDKRTALLERDIDPERFAGMDFKINTGMAGPKVLIFHTHSQEAYSDSEEGNINDGILAVGDRLAELLEQKYGIETLHDKTSFDVVNGKSSTLGAYERMESVIRDVLDKNPSIELVIDLHRDGVAENLRFTTNIDGRETAKIMFFNGLCRVYSQGELTETQGLSNPFIDENLALSFNLQLLANELFPDYTRKIYVNAYRYSLHFKPKSLLVEVGAQTNTKQEALNAMEPLAELLAKTIK